MTSPVTSTQHIAELNIGRLVAEPGDPRVAEFMGALDRINGMGKRMPGFVWIKRFKMNSSFELILKRVQRFGFVPRFSKINGIDPVKSALAEGSGEPGTGNTENNIGDDPKFVANLTVWEDVESLEHFVFNTVHKQFYDRREEWFEVMADQHFVMWYVEEGHKPTLDEALERLAYKEKHGDSDHAFGWSYIKEARLFREKSCRPIAAE